MTIAPTLDQRTPEQLRGLEDHTQQTRQERPPETESNETEINVGDTERLISGGVGGFLVLNGLNRLSLGGLLEAGLGAALLQRALSGHCALFAKLGVSTAGDGARPEDYFERGIKVEETFTINKPADELFAFWRNFENLPRFMTHLESVTCLEPGGKRSRWTAKGPAGMKIDWEAEIINEEPARLIAWRSLPGADVDNAGSVRFLDAPGERGTEVHVAMDYIPPAGRMGSWAAKLFGRDADQLIRDDLRRFKQLMEAGEIPTIQGQPRGTCTSAGLTSP